MSNVVEGKFGQKKELVFFCPHCEDGSAFWISADPGVMQCMACSARQFMPVSWMEEGLQVILDNTEDE